MADALASGASVRKDVGVQVPPRAPTNGVQDTSRTNINQWLTASCIHLFRNFGEPSFSCKQVVLSS